MCPSEKERQLKFLLEKETSWIKDGFDNKNVLIVMVIAHICDNIKTIEFYLGGGVFLLVVLEALLVGPDGSVLTRTNPVMMHSFSYPHGP